MTIKTSSGRGVAFAGRRRPKAAASAGSNPGTPAVVASVIARAKDMGLITSSTQQIGARLPERLLAQAKRRTGIQSTTELLAFALASVAVEDGFAEAFTAARGMLDPELDIGF